MVKQKKLKMKNKTFSFKLFKFNIFSSCLSNKQGWFRIFGYGIKWKNILIHPMLFSERNKLNKYILIKNYLFAFLLKNNN